MNTTPTVYTGPGTYALAVEAPGPATVRCSNDDAQHATFVDLYRPDVQREARWVLEPLDSLTATIAAGDVEITLGRGARLELA